MKTMRAKLGDISFQANASAEDKGSAFFVADPICTSYPFVNLNHFIFKPEAIRKNVKSMAMKPLNFMHEQEKIIGHINTAEFGMDSLGRTTASASGVLYRRIFPDLVEKMVNGQSYDMFKVSVEATMNDMNWVLFSSYSDIKETSQEKMLGEDPVLDDDAMFCLWLFGTLNGLKYDGKSVAVAIGGQSNDFEFVGLAVTDELNGGAADQNTRIVVLSSCANTVDAGMFISAKAADSSVSKFEIVKAIVRDEKEFLVHCGIGEDVAKNLYDEFAKFKENWIPTKHESIAEDTTEKEAESVVSAVAEESTDVISNESVAEAVAALVLARVEQADKTSRKYMRKIASLNSIVSNMQQRVVDAEKNLSNLVESSKCVDSAIESLKSEIASLRKSELISLELWDVAKASENDIVYMSSEEYSEWKKKQLSVPVVAVKKNDVSRFFEEQTKRVVRK
jgi:hypothetical protein